MKIDDDISYVANNIINIANQINKHSPNTEIFIQTILPINKDQFESTRGFYPNHNVPLNEKIKQINLKLYEHKSKNRYSIIDLYSIFISGQDMDERFSTDGVHLNNFGYDLWTEHIKQYLIEFI